MAETSPTNSRYCSEKCDLFDAVRLNPTLWQDCRRQIRGIAIEESPKQLRQTPTASIERWRQETDACLERLPFLLLFNLWTFLILDLASVLRLLANYTGPSLFNLCEVLMADCDNSQTSLTGNPSLVASLSEVAQELIPTLSQLHSSEYQALTTRATYFLTLMAGIFPLMGLYLALVVQLWRPSGISLWAAFDALLQYPGRRAFMLWGN